MSTYTDLVAAEYRTSASLDARIAVHQRFSENKQGWQRFVFDQLDLPATARILEIGAGIGALWRENGDRLPPGWDVTLTDQSEGMLDQARQVLAHLARPFACQVAEATALPFADGLFDAVIANHMLYYVADKPRAFAEFRRVLKPGGHLYAATNGARHLRELADLVAQFDPSIPFMDRTIVSYSLENAVPQLAAFFEDVEVRLYPDALVVTEAQPLIDYILSSKIVQAMVGARADELADFVRAQLAARNGVFRIHKETGVVCGRRSP